MIVKHIFEIYFGLLLLVTSVFYLTGFSLQKILRISISGIFKIFFFRLLTGCLFFTAGGALYYSKGMTVMFSLLLLGSYSYFVYLKSEQPIRKVTEPFKGSSLQTIIIVFLGAIVIYSIQYFSLFHNTHTAPIADLDTVYYSNVSNYLTQFGQEFLSLDFFQINSHGCEPYHYGDIWLNVVIKNIFNLNPSIVFKLITYPFLILLIFIGYCALAEQAGYNGWMPCLFALMFLNFGGLYFSFFENSRYLIDANIFSFNPLNYPKLALVFLLLQAAVLAYNEGYKLNAITLFAALPVFFITVFPAVGLAIFLFGFKNFVIQRNFKIAFKELSPLILVSTFLFLFYHFQPKGVSVNSNQFNETTASLLSLSYFITCFNIGGLSVLQCLVVYAPLIIVIAMTFSFKEIRSSLFKNDLVFITVGFYLSSLFSWALFHDVTQTVQLFFNGSVPILAVFTFLIAMYGWKAASIMKKQLLLVLMIFTLSSNTYYCYRVMKRENIYSEDYISSISGLIKESFSQGAFMLAPADYANVFARSSSYYVLGVHMAYYFPDYYSYSLSVFDMPIDKNYTESEKKYLDNSVFYRYVARQKEMKKFTSISQSRLDFLDEYKINHIFISQGVAIDSHLQSRIIKTITDSKTGEQFCLLKHQ